MANAPQIPNTVFLGLTPASEVTARILSPPLLLEAASQDVPVHSPEEQEHERSFERLLYAGTLTFNHVYMYMCIHLE